jgi:membrane protein DedA with SNARE-associated domain
LASIFLITQGVLQPVVSVILIVLGAIGEQLLWFWVGLKLGENHFISKWGHKLSHRFDPHLVHRTFHSLAISKFIYGFHRAVLIRSGMLKIGLKKFVKASIPATLIWLSIIGTLGFIFSASLGVLKYYLKYGELVLLLIILIFFVADYFVSKRLAKEL